MGQHKYIRTSGILNTDKNRFYACMLLPDDTGCMKWKGTKKSNGYGQFKNLNKQWFHAHRYSYSIFNGRIPDGLCVLHRCDNRLCVNPDHLFLGTKKDNTQDMIAKGRRGYVGIKGEEHSKAKLTNYDILIIRQRYKEGATYKKLAAEYNVNFSTIACIVTYQTWKHI